VRISQNPGVKSNKRTIHNTRCCHDDLIGWIAVKGAGKLRGLHADSRREIKKADPGISQCLLNPGEHVTRQDQALSLDEFRDLPTANRWDANASLR